MELVAQPANPAADQGASLGLTSAEAASRLTQFGRNEIVREAATSPWALLGAQFKSPVIWLLLATCVASGVLGDFADAIAIGAILVINAMVGFPKKHLHRARCWPPQVGSPAIWRGASS